MSRDATAAIQATRLAADCVYTIAKRSSLGRLVAEGRPHVEAKWWAKGKRLLDAARVREERLPVLFADATHCERLMGWALIDAIEPWRDGGTSMHFSHFRELAGPSTQELLLLKTGEPIAPGFIRPYALCKTPWFLHQAARSPAVDLGFARAWVVKGSPQRNDFEAVLRPGRREDWTTKKPPKGWAAGDIVFLWESAPALHVVGLGFIADLPERVDPAGDAVFVVEYLTGPLTHRLGIDELRDDDVLGRASFLKSGPAQTVFPLSREHARRLAELVATLNPSCKDLFDARRIGSKERAAVAEPTEQSVAAFRQDPREAERVFRSLFPDDDVARAAAELLANSVRTAHAEAPGSWQITLQPDRLRLNVGQVAVCTMHVDEPIRLVMCAPASTETHAGLSLNRTDQPVYSAVPVASVVVDVHEEARARVPQENIDAYHAFIVEAARRKTGSPFQQYFSLGVVLFLEELLGSPLPRPAYFEEPSTTRIHDANEVVDEGIFEGAKTRITVNRYERDPGARRRCIEHHGAKCVVCEMVPGEAYGPTMEGRIHVHHLRPLSEIGAEYEVDPRVDLVPVCPNCHAAIHSVTPPFSPEEVRATLRLRRTRGVPGS